MAKRSVPVLEIRKRLILIFFLLTIVCGAFIIRLGWIQFVQADSLEEKALEQWNRSIPARSPRGSILDCRGELLAGSATIETIMAIPPQIKDAEVVASQLSPILEMEEERILELITQEKGAVYVKRQVDEEVAREVRNLDLPGITFTQESKRYYPHGKLASQLLGFVGVDQGWSGLELYYEEELKGRDGRIIFPSDALGRQIPHEVRQFIPPKEGLDLILTVDKTIQFIVERELDRAMVEFEPKKVMALAVNPQTGEILAAASKPDFDPNDYASYPEESWTLAPLTGTFEPGSTFKLVTLAAAIEEGLYRQEEDFTCTGSLTVAGTTINCWRTHGSINFLEAVKSSCNAAFMTLGERIGKKKLLQYIEAFGFGQESGVDYPGEGEGIVFDAEAMGPVELATTSFGQGISVTPLQQVMLVSAFANGGKLMRPFLVKEIRDQEGNLAKRNKPEVVRRILSASTTREVSEIMEQVVVDGSGMNAYIEGYRIAGKTGTAQKVGSGGNYISGEYILSFVGFAPLEDPQIVLYIAVDGAKRGPQWGSQISAPIFRRIMEDVLKYLDIAPRLEEEDPFKEKVVEVPDLVGLTVDEAGAVLEDAGLMLKLVGEGEKIIRQTPKPGAAVPLQTDIIVYLSDDHIPVVGEQMEVPDVRGMTIREAGEVLCWLDLHIKPLGSGVAVRQNPEPGALVPPGTIVEVNFSPPAGN